MLQPLFLTLLYNFIFDVLKIPLDDLEIRCEVTVN